MSVARIETVIIGAGHAGLAMSHCLSTAKRQHVVLERGVIGERWKSERWDSFTLLSPNWHTRLPGHAYRGADQDGFMSRDEMVRFLSTYAATFDAPVRTGVTVVAVERGEGDAFLVRTQGESIEARNVVVAVGHYHGPKIPSFAEGLGRDKLQIHSSAYRAPSQLPPGAVLVVGAGASGHQIAEDLLEAERRVFLSVGRHNKLPRRYRGRDTVWWMDQMGMFDVRADSLPSLEEALKKPSVSLTGVAGGRDLDLYDLARRGAVLLGRVTGIDGDSMTIAGDLDDRLREGEEGYTRFVRSVDAWIDKNALDAPAAAPPHARPPTSPTPRTPRTLDLAREGISTTLWATGYRTSLEWIKLPAFGADGEPAHVRGVTPIRGLYFLGLRWLYKRKSNFIDGVAEDVAYLAERIASGRPPD